MRYEDDNGTNGNEPDAYTEPEFETTEAEPGPELGLYEATRRVNKREAASTDAPIVGILEQGDRVPVAAIEAGWATLTSGELVKVDYLSRSSQ